MESCASIRRLMLHRIRGKALLLAVLAASVTTGCSAVVDTDKAKLGPSPVPCEAGQTATCPCRDGTTSTQKCNAMSRFDPCACGGSAGRSGAGSSGSGGRAGSRAR